MSTKNSKVWALNWRLHKRKRRRRNGLWWPNIARCIPKTAGGKAREFRRATPLAGWSGGAFFMENRKKSVNYFRRMLFFA